MKNKNGEMVFSQITPKSSERRFQDDAPYDVWIGTSTGVQANFGGEEIPVKPCETGVRTVLFIAGKE